MRVRADVFLGENSYLDLSFLKNRETWLPRTGIYLELILKGEYEKKVDFSIESDSADAISISRYSWNRFFLNIQESGKVTFKVLVGKKILCKDSLDFKVAEINLPLLFSVPNLLHYPISDIRFFANRISENLVNATRFSLLTPSLLKVLSQSNFRIDNSIWKLYEITFSILTERGITIVLTPFDIDAIYTLDFLKEIRGLLFEFIKRSKKFNIVWDLSQGLRNRELEALVDSVAQGFKNELALVVPPGKEAKVGGEGFAFSISPYKDAKDIPLNERGIKIARIEKHCDYYELRKFVQQAVQMNHGVEYIVSSNERTLRRMKYSISRALYSGYFDAVSGKEERS